jgi:nondiscriminating glutamyl-tRNA synthetase
MPDIIRTRFAPSPTGFMHVGNVHTALFSWLTARHFGGQFLLRIEDTDEVRSTPEALNVIYGGLRWLGLNWDEGPDIGGPHAPYVQSERLDIYHSYLDKLLEEGRAYKCYCTPEELEQERQIMRARGQAPRYSGRCAKLTDAQRRAYEEEGRPACIRFRVKETGATVIPDLIQGDVTYENALIADSVIFKTSGYPTFHFAVVVDDYLMQVSHIIRGVEHLPNTQIHMQLQEALGFTTPHYAHLPIILGEDRTKLSKRHGSVAVTDYEAQGYLPEAMFNFLTLLGWAPGDENEVLSREDIISRFSLEACNKAPAVFDLKKAEWLNGEYIKQGDLDTLTAKILPRLQAAGLFEQEPSAERVEWLGKVIDLMRERAKLLSVFEGWARYFFTDDYDYDARAREQWLSKPETAPVLAKLADRLEALDAWTCEAIEAAVRCLATDLGLKAAGVIHPCRAAVTGTTIGPSLFHLLELLPKETVLRRLRATEARVAAGELQALPEPTE